jgi:2'-5' RNA ligase
VGIKDSELTSLMRKVNQTLNYLRQEEHEETPHLTIARVKSGKDKEKLQKLVENYKNTWFGEMKVDKMVLYESELGKEGPKYTLMQEFQLQSKELIRPSYF